MKKLEMLGYFWIFTSISLCIGLYKLELSKRVIDEEYEYIKKHRAFGNLTKYLTIIAIIIVVLLNCKIWCCLGHFRTFDNVYRIFSKERQFIL